MTAAVANWPNRCGVSSLQMGFAVSHSLRSFDMRSRVAFTFQVFIYDAVGSVVTAAAIGGMVFSLPTCKCGLPFLIEPERVGLWVRVATRISGGGIIRVLIDRRSIRRGNRFKSSS